LYQSRTLEAKATEMLTKENSRLGIDFIPGISETSKAYFSVGEYIFIRKIIDEFNDGRIGNKHRIALYRDTELKPGKSISDSKLFNKIYSWFRLASKHGLSNVALNIKVNTNPSKRGLDHTLSFALLFSGECLFPKYHLSEVVTILLSSYNHYIRPRSFEVKHEVIYFDIDKEKLSRVLTQLSNKSNLNYLKFEHNTFAANSYLLFEFEKLQHLTILNLAKNELTKLDPRIQHLKNLKYLNLSNNKLPTIPSWIGKFKKLEHLNLSNNRMTQLPEEIAELSNLKRLNLSKNQFSELPLEIAELPNLEELLITGNPISKSTYKKLKWLIPSVKIYYE